MCDIATDGISDAVYLNDKYQVNVTLTDKQAGFSGVVHLSIKRRDKEAIHDWRDLQLIKNMVVGKEREAVEIYPAESRLVDTCNQYHLWVLPEGIKVDVGFTERLVAKGHDSTSKQRPFKDDEEPKDALTLEEINKLADDYKKNHYI